MLIPSPHLQPPPAVQSVRPSLFSFLLANFFLFPPRMAMDLPVAISSQRWPRAVLLPQHRPTRPICSPFAPQPCRIRASITGSISLQTATLQPTTCDSHAGSRWRRRGHVLGGQGREGGVRKQPKKAPGLAGRLAGRPEQPLIKGISID